ncbi:MAG: ABC transporter permease [Parabacteroides sp.]|nr:ABC transporter permease [Parabacteroides sp.]
MSTITRNFLSVLKRFRMASALNIIGLSIAFATFVVIMIQVTHEQQFDNCYPTSKRIFLVKLNNSTTSKQMDIFPGAFPDVVTQPAPHIVAGALRTPAYNDKNYISVEAGGVKRGFRERITTCGVNLPQVFGFTFVDGDAKCLKDPEKAIIPQSMAKRLFGDTPAVGQRIHSEGPIWTKPKGMKDLTVGAVYRDFPSNTQLDNSIYTQIDMKDPNINSWGAYNYECYLLLDDAASADAVTDNLNRHFNFDLLKWDKSDKLSIELVPLTKIHYLDTKDIWGAGSLKTGSRDTTNLLFFIGMLILVIAAINYMNLSTALVPMRIRSINTQKVLGSSTAVLRFSMIVEAVGICLISYLFSLLIVYAVNRSNMLSFMEADLSLHAHIPLLLGVAAIAVAVGLLAGLYPSYYITSFSPALVLKGSFGLSQSGRRLRTALIGCQYIISVALIVGACIVQLQNRYMRHYKLGFDQDQIAIVPLNDSIYKTHHDAYASQLLKYPEVDNVAFAASLVGGTDEYPYYEFTHNEEKFHSTIIAVSPSFMKVMGIKVQEGTDFMPSSDKDTTISMIFNETARKAQSLQVGDKVNIGNECNVIGFTGDVKLTSLRNEVTNMAFVVSGNRSFGSLSYSYIRLKAGYDAETAVKHIREVVAEIDPSFPVDVKFYDSVFNDLYQNEQFIKKMVTIASFLAILISIVGVFGLVIFETEYRRKEIGIRKVHGATVGNILLMFNRKYFYIVLCSFVFAAPVAYWGAQKWLQNFAYKVPLHWWVFGIAFLIILLVTLFTVSFQNWRTANENPVKSLHCE